MHEDEDGQLYFKDDSGALQPVYLTEDGHYAIAESSEDHENKETSAKSQQISRQVEEESSPVPENEPKPFHNSKQVFLKIFKVNQIYNISLYSCL